MSKLDNAKSTLWYYFELIARKAGANLDSDCRTEIEGIIDDIVESINITSVEHGLWEFKCEGSYNSTKAYCTSCGKPSGIGGIRSNQLKPYCPNCGAKMDVK